MLPWASGVSILVLACHLIVFGFRMLEAVDLMLCYTQYREHSTYTALIMVIDLDLNAYISSSDFTPNSKISVYD